MRVCLFDDQLETLHPLTLTRSTHELRCGLGTLGDKIYRHLQASSCGALVRAPRDEAFAVEHPSVVCNDTRWLGDSGGILANGRWLPPPERAALGEESVIGMVGDEVAYVKVSAEQLRFVAPPNVAEFLEHWKDTLPRRAAGGMMVRYPWDLVEANGRQILQDYREWRKTPSAVLSDLGLSGPRENLWVHPSARVEPMVMADTKGGPVVIDRDAVVTAFTRLEGPCYIGPGTHVLGAKIRAGTTLGPCCRVGGEVEASILQGYVNKYHEGFLGHSYVGSWVNLAAGTHTSDLRCDYGEVTMPTSSGVVPSGQQKVGAFIGDHTRTGLGVLMNTGSTVGAFCQLLPGPGFTPRAIPSFSHWTGSILREADHLEQQFAIARTVMGRRGRDMTTAHTRLYEAVFSETTRERKAVVRALEQKRLRKSA